MKTPPRPGLWPVMTMAIRVRGTLVPNTLTTGNTLRFGLEKLSGEFTVTPNGKAP